MIITDSRGLGALIRQRRHELAWSQTRLAELAAVSRPWISELETGKSSAEIGLVFSVLHALGIHLSAIPSVPRSRSTIDDRGLYAFGSVAEKATGSTRVSKKKGAGKSILSVNVARPLITKDGKSLGIARARSSFNFSQTDKQAKDRQGK